MPLPYTLANGPGNWPDAEKYMANWHWILAMSKGSFIDGGGFETWSAGASISNPSNGAPLSDSWMLEKGGTSGATADFSRDASVFDTGAYGLKADLTAAGSSDSYIRIAQAAAAYARFSGRTMFFGAMVKTATASKVRISITDGVTTAYSTYHTGDGTWQKLTVALACSTSISELTGKIEITSDFDGDAVYVDSAFLYDIESTMSSTARSFLEYYPPVAEAGSIPSIAYLDLSPQSSNPSYKNGRIWKSTDGQFYAWKDDPSNPSILG